MLETKSFRNTGRVTYLILALALVLLAALWGCAGDEPETTAPKPAAGPATTGGMEFGTIAQVTGQPYMLMPLQKAAGEDVSVHNYLSIDPESGTMRWVFPNHSSRILDRNELVVKDAVMALLYRVVAKDTNADGQLTAADGLTLALTAPDGSGHARVIEGIDALQGFATSSDGTLVVVYSRGDASHMARISLKDFSLIGETPLPRV